MSSRLRGGAAGPDARAGKKRDRRSSAAAHATAAAAAAQQQRAEADGKRGLIVECKYANELPLPPVPKLLRALPASERLCRYRPTSLELDHRPFLLSEEDLLACVEFVDPTAYGELPQQGSMPPPPPPQDGVLLQDGDVSAEVKEAERKRRRLTERTDAFHREAFGLQLPQLITNDVFTERQRFTTGCEATEKKILRDPPGYKSMEDVIERIEQTFVDAGKPPVHPTKPSMKAKRVLPIVPDAVLWANKYRQASFDELLQEPRKDDILFKTTPTPRSTCFGFFSPTEEGSNTFQQLQNYVWDNRGGFYRAVGCNEGEAMLLSFPPDDDETGEIRFCVAPAVMKLKKQKAYSLELANDTRSLTVNYREPSDLEALEQRELSKAVMEEEADQEDTTTFHFVDGEWHIRGENATSNDEKDKSTPNRSPQTSHPRALRDADEVESPASADVSGQG